MPHIVDTHVGKRIRHRRWMMGVTQQQLAETIGIKFQQVQKYETGANRVSASRLWDISRALEVPVSFFFDGIENGNAVEEGEAGEAVRDVLADKEALQLIRAYYTMPEEQRRQIFELARVLSRAA
ncbi:helix-turn-helix domain-containing protein [Paracoccus sp. S-4012]|uniref:helix-turn-helix domain-containing protein n=1 Tax=Paracoccus sp. S-4012 TaxID=2665648 RepID=UPI0012AFCE4E|nr:helix-turn-helix transcriptional regulator [Paracoccus sp. S-4012]MRX51566.1 helix-turn-helix domain-containing protein [Paracoccus sp. S-4012]